MSDKKMRIQTREARKQFDRKIEKIENEIELKEKEIKNLTAVLHDPAHSSNFELLHETMQKLDAVKKTNEELVGEWGKLQEKMEE
jgi:hypothetical protein